MASTIDLLMRPSTVFGAIREPEEWRGLYAAAGFVLFTASNPMGGLPLMAAFLVDTLLLACVGVYLGSRVAGTRMSLLEAVQLVGMALYWPGVVGLVTTMLVLLSMWGHHLIYLVFAVSRIPFALWALTLVILAVHKANHCRYRTTVLVCVWSFIVMPVVLGVLHSTLLVFVP